MQKFAPGKYDPDKDVWELYNLKKDFSQAHNLASENPDILKDLIETWWKEAERNRALPLLAGFSIFFGILPPLPTTTRFTFMGDVQNIQRGMVPRIFGRSYAIEAELNIPGDGAEGVIVANADFMGGFSLWVDENSFLHHTYSFLGVEVYKQVSDEPLPSGDVSVKMLFEADEPRLADFHGHGWLYRNVYKRDWEGRLVDKDGLEISSFDPRKWERAVHLKDIHLERGMHCVDCHFEQDAHGDGHLYGSVRDAVEIACEDCHDTIRERTRLVTSGPAAPEGGRDLAVGRAASGQRRFVERDGKVFQRSSVTPGVEWEVPQIADGKTSNPASWRARTIQRDNETPLTN